MSRKLMMNNIENSDIIWDYHFKSNDENGTICTSNDIFGNNTVASTITVGEVGVSQIIEVTLKKTTSTSDNSPQILICNSTNNGIKVHATNTQWTCTNTKEVLGQFNSDIFVTIKIEKINEMSKVYFNGELKAQNQADYNSTWNTFNGIKYSSNIIYIKEIKYKKL